MDRKVLIIANKQFEVHPLVGVLTSPEAQAAGSALLLRDQREPAATRTGRFPDLAPRISANLDDCEIGVWCVQDLMDPAVAGGGSNTSEKARVLSLLFEAESARTEVALVIAFGTAATPQPESANGCVKIGRSIFNHNPYAATPGKSPSAWAPPDMLERVLSSAFPASTFDALSFSTSPVPTVNARLLQPFGVPAEPVSLLHDAEGVAVSSVNVVDYQQFPITDPAALAAAAAAGVVDVASLESTHGVIRAQSDAPFLYVSGITNRVGQFAAENQAYPYTQNFVASHNAAVALTWLLGWAVQAVC